VHVGGVSLDRRQQASGRLVVWDGKQAVGAGGGELERKIVISGGGLVALAVRRRHLALERGVEVCTQAAGGPTPSSAKTTAHHKLSLHSLHTTSSGNAPDGGNNSNKAAGVDASFCQSMVHHKLRQPTQQAKGTKGRGALRQASRSGSG
jgi:hypothetical protein